MERKAALKPGFDADIILIDSEKEWEITSESLKYVNKISAFVGMKGKGLPVCTIVRGEVVAQDGDVTDTKGYGELVKKIKEK